MFKSTQTLPKKRVAPNKLVLSFAVLAATAVVGSAGIANAAQPDKPSKADCSKAGYKNYGQCVKDWAHKKNHPGGGYGGNGGGNHNNVSNRTDVNLDVQGNNNVITIIVRNITNIFN